MRVHFCGGVCAAPALTCAFVANSAQAQTECPEGQTRLTKVIAFGVADDTGCVADDAAEILRDVRARGGPYSHSRFDDRFDFAIGVHHSSGRCRVLYEVDDASFSRQDKIKRSTTTARVQGRCRDSATAQKPSPKPSFMAHPINNPQTVYGAQTILNCLCLIKRCLCSYHCASLNIVCVPCPRRV